MAQKKVSAALTPVYCESWSITTTPSSASAANVRCWACRDPRSITGPHRCGHRRCGSWPGSMLSTWRIPAAAAAGSWSPWPEMGSRSAAIGCETSCGAWVYGRNTRSPVPQGFLKVGSSRVSCCRHTSQRQHSFDVVRQLPKALVD